VSKSASVKGPAVKTRVARHEVREEIQRRILSGESKPGERLSQQSLARELGVAQGTVRESLLELNWLGLVQSVDRMGVFVDKLDASSICEAYQVRAVLEGFAARLACGNAGRADTAELRDMAGKIYQLAKDNNSEAGHLDRSFHMRITELSRNSTLTRLAQSYRVLGMSVRAFRNPDIIYAEHLRIVEAIEHDFAEEAEHLARNHVASARQTIESMVKQGSFVPDLVS
jgi:DNA-binding GntR family transcriptional regulator